MTDARTDAKMAPPSSTLTLLLLTTVIVIVAVDAKCPRKCSCIWRDAKITVDCSNKGLAGIPSNVDPSTQVISIWVWVKSVGLERE